MASSGLKWLHLGGFSTNYAPSLDRRRKLAFNLSITSPEQDISAKQFLAVNLRGAFEAVFLFCYYQPCTTVIVCVLLTEANNSSFKGEVSGFLDPLRAPYALAADHICMNLFRVFLKLVGEPGALLSSECLT
jgi:hypothetical protein